MTAVAEGTIAPDFALRATDGTTRRLRPSQRDGLVVLAFSKRSCPVCQFTLPFVDALHRAYAGQGVEIFGISQDDRKTTLAFAAECNLALPYLIDADNYQVSAAYGLTNVPTLFLVDGDGEVLINSVGFSQADIVEISKHLARRRSVVFYDPFAGRDDIPQFRPG